MSYYEKYLKYKNKYVTLKKQIGGGDCKTRIGSNKYNGCNALQNGCKMGDYNYEKIVFKTSEDTDKDIKNKKYNDDLTKNIKKCSSTLKELLDAGYTIKEIQFNSLLPYLSPVKELLDADKTVREIEVETGQPFLSSFIFPDIVKYNNEATKKLVFNDMNELDFGNFGTYGKPDFYQFATCYDKFDYSNLTSQSIKVINNNIIGKFAANDSVENNKKFLDMILFFAKIILSKDLVGSNSISISELTTRHMPTLHTYISTLPEIYALRWK